MESNKNGFENVCVFLNQQASNYLHAIGVYFPILFTFARSHNLKMCKICGFNRRAVNQNYGFGFEIGKHWRKSKKKSTHTH